MPEGGLKCEYVHAPLHRVCGMTVPQLVRVVVESSSTSLFAANISNRLSSEMSLATGVRKYIAVSFAAAKRLKKLERVAGHSNSPCFGSFSKEVDLTAIGENFDVLLFHNCDLRNSATQEIRTPDKGVITPVSASSRASTAWAKANTPGSKAARQRSQRSPTTGETCGRGPSAMVV